MPAAPFCSRTRGVMPQPAGLCFSFSFADHTPSLTGTWRSLLLSPSSRSALSLPLPLFSFWFFFFLSFSFSFTADHCLSLTGTGTPSCSQMQGIMPHSSGSFSFLLLFHLLTTSLMGTPPARPFVAHCPCLHRHHLRHVALASVVSASSRRSRLPTSEWLASRHDTCFGSAAEMEGKV